MIETDGLQVQIRKAIETLEGLSIEPPYERHHHWNQGFQACQSRALSILRGLEAAAALVTEAGAPSCGKCGTTCSPEGIYTCPECGWTQPYERAAVVQGDEGIKGIDRFVDEIYEIPESHFQRDRIRTVLSAFVAHVKRQTT